MDAQEGKNQEAKNKSHFIGWQKTPIHTARFGATTRSGKAQESVRFIHARGSQQKEVFQWFEIDAASLPVGRLATVAASILSGKFLASYTPGAGSGAGVVITNANKAFFSSNKADKKFYYRHSGWVGGLKVETAREALHKHPERVIESAVHGMLPKNRLSRKQLRHLKVFHGADHEMKAQKPKKLKLQSKSLLKFWSNKEGKQ